MGKRKDLFKKSQGGSEIPWCLDGSGTDEPETCEGCGTVLKDGGSRSTILGYTILDQCCGAYIDKLYAVFGERFAEQYLEEFAKDPLGELRSLQYSIRPAVEAWDKAAKEEADKASATAAIVPERS